MTRALLWLVGTLATLVAILLVLIASALWYGHTQNALERVVAEAVARSGGRLKVEGASGSALGPFAFARIEWRDGPLLIVAEDLHGSWSPRALLSKRLQIAELTVARLSVTSEASAAPSSPPTSVALPLPMAIDRLVIATLEVDSGGTRIAASDLELGYAGDDSGHHVRGLHFISALGRVSADADLSVKRPFALGGSIGFMHPDQHAPIDAIITLGGDLATPTMALKVSVGAAAVDGAATLRPFDASWLQSLSLTATAVDLAQFNAAWPRTRLSFSGNAATANDGTISGNFDAINAQPGPLTDRLLPVRRAQSTFRLQNERVALPGLRVALSGEGNVTGSATVGFIRTDLDLALAGVDLRAIHRPLRATRLSGTVRAEIEGEVVNAKALLREKDLSLGLELVHREGRIDLRQFRAEARGGSLSGSGRLTLTGAMPFALNARAAHLNPAAFGEFVPASIDAEIAATGALDPQWSADVRFKIDERSRLRGLPLAGDGHLLAAPIRVRDVDVRLRVASNALQARGAFGQAGDHLDLTLDAPQLKQIDASLDGKLSATASVSGAVTAPAVSLELRGSSLRAGERYSVASISAKANVAVENEGQAQVEVSARDLAAPQGSLASASLRVRGTLSNHEAELSVAGSRVDATLKVHGGWQRGSRPQWQGSVVNFEQRGDIAVTLLHPFTLEVGHDHARVSDVALNVDKGQVAVRYFRWEAHRFSSEGEFSGLPVSLALKFSPAAENVSSTLIIGGDWSIDASPRMNGQLRVHREAGDLASKDITGLALGLTAFDLDARFNNDALTATLGATSAQLGTANVRLELTPPAGADSGALDRRAPAHVVASFQLASLKAVEVFTGTNAVIDGRLRANLEGRGTLGNLMLTGQVDGDGFKIDAPQYGVAVRDGRLRAELRNDELRVSELRLNAGEGRFDATGTLPLRADLSSASTLQWKAERFTLLNRPDQRLVLDGSGVLTWEAKRIALSGSLRAEEGHFEFASKDTTSLGDDVVVKGREAATLEYRRGSVAKVPLKLDVDLDLGPRLTVVGYGFDARLDGRVKLTTAEDGTLLAQGKVTAVNGTYLAFGQKLVLERGDLYFNGPIDNPGLDVLAIRRNLPVDVGVAISGTAKTPRAQLTSNPPMPDGDKLSWLVLGHAPDTTAGSENQALQSAAAVLFGSTIASSGSSLASKVGLDDVSIHGRASGAEGQVVSFGKRIADRLYVAIEQGLSGVTGAALRLEYTLTRFLTLRAEAGTVSSFGIYYSESFK
jgi:translocation and assembly module TamB